jgi:hypothetical protein
MSIFSSFSILSLSYSIAIVLSFLVLLMSYFCCCHTGGRDYWARNTPSVVTPAFSSGHISITVPHVLFVAEDSESPNTAYSSFVIVVE